MAKIVVKGARIALRPSGAWSWSPQAGEDLLIEISEAGTPVSVGQAAAPLASAVLDAIRREVRGKAYHHLPQAASGKVAAVDATLDSGTETARIKVAETALATDATTGRFKIFVGQPSVLATPTGPVSDLQTMHAGTWRIVDPKQRLLSEAEKDPAARSAPSAAAPVRAGSPPTPEQEEPGEEEPGEEGEPKTALRLLLSLTAGEDEPGREASLGPEPFWSAGGARDPLAALLQEMRRAAEGDLLGLWGSVLLREQARLRIEIRIAQPQGAGGLAGRFHRDVRASDLLERDAKGVARPAQTPLSAALEAVELDPAAPVWMKVWSHVVTAQDSSLGLARIGLTSHFAPPDQKTVIVAPPTPSGRARITTPGIARSGKNAPPGIAKPSPGVRFVKEAEIFGDDEAGRAERLIEALPEGEGWIRFDSLPDPEPDARDWSRIRPALKRAFVISEIRDEKKRRIRQCEPLPVKLAAESPRLLALAAAARALAEPYERLRRSHDQRLERANLAMLLCQMQRTRSLASTAVSEVLAGPFKEPDALLGRFEDPEARDLSKKSGGFIRLGSLEWGSAISAPRLYLALHAADLLEQGLAFGEPARRFFSLLADPATVAEQEAARLRLGPAALDWANSLSEDAKPGALEAEDASQEESRLIWLAQLLRQLEPSWSAQASAAAFGGEIAMTLKGIDDHLAQMAAVLSAGSFSERALCGEQAPRLLTNEIRRALNLALVEQGGFQDLAGLMAYAPLLTLIRDPAQEGLQNALRFKSAPGVVRKILEWPERMLRTILGLERKEGFQLLRSERFQAALFYMLASGSHEVRSCVQKTAVSLLRIRIPGSDALESENIVWFSYAFEKTQKSTKVSGENWSFRETRQTFSASIEVSLRGDGLEASSTKFDRALDGFGLAFAAMGLLRRMTDDGARDMLAEMGEGFGEIVAILEISTNRLGVRAISFGADVFGVRVSPALAKGAARLMAQRLSFVGDAVGVAVSSYRIWRDIGEKPLSDLSVDILSVISSGAGLASFVLLAAGGPLFGILLTISLVVGAAALVTEVFQDDHVPDDVQNCLDVLRRHVGESSFGRSNFQPQTKQPAREWRASTSPFIANKILRPSQEEEEWLARVLEAPDRRSGDNLKGLAFATAALETRIEPAVFRINFTERLTESFRNLTPETCGSWLSLPLSMLCGISDPVILLPYGEKGEASMRLRLRGWIHEGKLRLEGETEGRMLGGGFGMRTAFAAPTSQEKGAPLGALILLNRGAFRKKVQIDIPLDKRTQREVRLYLALMDPGEARAEIRLPSGGTETLSRRERHDVSAQAFSVSIIPRGAYISEA
ncbi:hypothetical protein [Neomegalonema sp.]|uniref:hypothetical protein n=1 Tax=Neomegalonema sp. TaxID=2039713 RepID=UPI00261511DC|nr:hypothetical protein [Neomegalonema sp.]MDD2869314.1 hypothetical protein [Neomegalonema sp.]